MSLTLRLALLAIFVALSAGCCDQVCEPNNKADCTNCPSCVVRVNPDFNRQCAADIVLIFDESGSIAPFLNDVRAAARSFFSAFSQVNSIGGVANLGLLEFAQNARLVTAGGNAGVMRTLDATWVGQLNAYIENNATGQGAAGYLPGGCTNWGQALQLAFQTSWRQGSTAGPIARPDVILWFTDGAPTTHGPLNGPFDDQGRCGRNCNDNSVRLDNGLALGANQGADRGVACFWADQIKAAGTKLFLVGVGDVAGNIPQVVLTTGPTAWNQQADTFGPADYVVNADYAALGAIFYNVAKGLCKCLQDQTPCQDTGAAPLCANQMKFDAYVVVSASSTSAQWPINSVVEAYLYYEFNANPARFAWEVMSGTTLLRTDIVNPCSVSRRIGCPGSTCGTIADKALIPRFFVSRGVDVANPPAPAGRTSTCGSLFQHPSVTQPEEIQYVWVNAANSICAARAVDGTFYEFFTSSAKTTPGANQRGTNPPQQLRLGTAPFDFLQLSTCASPTCNADVDLVFAIDTRFPSLTDWTNVKNYVNTIVTSFADSNNRIRAAAVFADGTRIPSTGFETALASFGNQVRAQQRPATATTSWDIAGTLTSTINTLWPASRTPVDAPRYLLTIVGGPDVNNPTGPIAALDTARNSKNVEMWAIGVAAGSNQVQLLPLISDQPPAAKYVHSDVLGLSSLLVQQVIDQSSRMCPVSDLCNGNCPSGLCLCGVCSCPPACRPVTSACQVSACAAPAQGCVFFDKSVTFQPNGCVPTNPDPCKVYDCDGTGKCISGGTTKCAGACGCTAGKVTPCKINDPSQSCTQCTLVDVTCGGDVCASSCNPTTGQCTVPACDDGNACTDDLCVVRQVGGQGVAFCQFTDQTTKYCNASTECAVPKCTTVGGQRQCSEVNITSLFDLCGKCNGDFATCFFSNVNQSSTAAGIAAGVVAAIVIAVIIALVILFLLGRKGAQYWAARSALAQPSMQNNAAFKANSLSGENVAYSSM